MDFYKKLPYDVVILIGVFCLQFAFIILITGVLYIKHRISLSQLRKKKSEEVYFKSIIEGNKKEEKIKDPLEKEKILKLKEKLRALAEDKKFL